MSEDVRRLFAAFHREEPVSEEQLEAALSLSPGPWRSPSPRDAVLQARHPGESVVNVPTPFVICRQLFTELDLGIGDCVVDLGCGDGRVVLYGALTSPARLRGVELVAQRARMGQRGAQRLGLERVEVVCGNVLDEDLSVASVFYLFRPFSVETEAIVLDRLHDEARRRAITVASYRVQPSSFDLAVFERRMLGALLIHRSR